MRIKLLFLFCLALIMSCATTPVIAVNIDPALMPVLTGVNAAGGEIYYKDLPGNGVLTSGSQFLFISHQDVDYLASKNMNFIRLLFSWEAMQPTLNGALDVSNTYGKAMKDVVDYATSKNLFVMVEPHGASSDAFITYRGNKVGTVAVPNASFGDFWHKMADIYKGNPHVLFGLGNEPNTMGTMQWYSAAQAGIDGIRASGSTQTIMVPGNGWSQPSSWNDTWYDTSTTKVSNAVGWLTLKDPKNNLIVSVHTYADANGGGGANDIVSATIFQERIAPVVAWARTNKLKVHLSEYGVNASQPLAQPTLVNLMNYIKANSDVLVGSSAWGYGPPTWWGGYTFTMCPKNNYTTDDPKMTWVSPFFTPPTAAIPTVTPAPTPTPTTTPTPTPTTPPVVSPTKPVNPIAFTKNTVFTTNSGQTNWVFVPNSYDTTHNTPMQLLVWSHGCGGQSQFDISMVSPGGNQSYIALAVGGREKACWAPATDSSLLLGAINDLKTHFNIDPNKIVLGGYSSGGDLTYHMVFYNSNLFAGAIVENSSPFRDTGSTQAASLAAATRKMNIVHLAHLQDTTYPIAGVRTETDAVKVAGFPLLRLETDGGHYDAANAVENGHQVPGTAADLQSMLLPYMNAGWNLTTSTPVDAGAVDAGVVDSGVKDAGVVDSGVKDAGSTPDASVPLIPFYAYGQVYNSSTTGGVNGTGWTCMYFYVKNTQKVTANWSLMYVNTQGAKFTSFWSMKTNQAIGTVGSVKFSPVDVATIPALTTSKVGGACFDLATTRATPTVSGIN